MNIAIIGYGKMGKNIETLATQRKHKISYTIDKNNQNDLLEINKTNTDVCIEFSTPCSAYNNIKKCLEKGVPVVSGTTGWLEKKNEIENICLKNNTAFLYSSNFSIGMNLFFELNKSLSMIMRNHNKYIPIIEETHHKEKKDSPSGTALTLKNDLPNNPKIISKRKDNIIGTHKVKYYSDNDEIEIIHNAHNRKGYALGAIIAAEWIEGKNGIFDFREIISLIRFNS
ncbi:MAG: 4-hydroxy-tetrahydrodipicolinate reductase [Bacteroidetes bacterium]|nr:4-hydroxy-tetrahydrodipicolinate reductase [Bacteroidota bacterium]